MTTSHGRRIQSRRALAMMAWVSLVVIAGLLWYGQENDLIRIQAWEPAALMLSAYAAFLAIFGWLLFAPERKSAEESPALFFSGMLTLIPPCFIAYHLMPPSSPIRGWLTLGVFVFGLIAILSPLPDEVFAVPRDRKSYLQPLTDCYLSILDVEAPQLELESLVPRTYSGMAERGTQDRQPPTTGGGPRDPWTDPFYGTGRQMSEVGSARRATYSESRSRSSDAKFDGAPLREPSSRLVEDPEESVTLYGPATPAYRSTFPPVPTPPTLTPPPVPPVPVTTLPLSQETFDLTRAPMTARSAFAARESRTPNYQPAATQSPGGPTPVDRSATSIVTTVVRRPLTDPGGPARPAVGFQSPPALRPVTSSPPPVPSYLAPVSAPVPVQPLTSVQMPTRSPLQRALSELNRDETNRAASADVSTPAARRTAVPQVTPPAPRELTSRPATAVTSPSSGLDATGVTPSLASPATNDDALRSAVSEFRSLTDPASSESTLRELDRRMKELEADDEQDNEVESVTSGRSDSPQTSAVLSGASPSAGTPSRLNDVRMERIKDEYGGEMIDGTIKVFFEVGQKRAHLHVPFSPPLPGVPEVECEPIGDDSVRLKVGVRQPYGIRIEARRSEAGKALNTEIGFAAVYTSPARRT